MSATYEVALTDEEWAVAVEGSTRAFLQLASPGGVFLHIGDTMPASGTKVGIWLSEDADTSASIEKLAADTDKVFIRNDGQQSSVRAIVVATEPLP